MEFYLFDYNFTLGIQHLFFFLIGCLIACIALYVFAPAVARRERARKISHIRQIKNLQNAVCSLTDELDYFRKKYFAAIESFKKIDKQTKETEDTIITLSQEKDKLLTIKKLIEAERNHYYIQCDKLKAEIYRLTSPAYVK